MFKLTWKSWLVVLLAIGLMTGGLTVLLRAQGAVTVASWMDLVGGVLANGWTLYGLYRWREVPWVKRINTYVLTSACFGFFILLFSATGWMTGRNTAIYLYAAVLGFLLGIDVLRLLLRPGLPMLGVARTMIEEALRMGIALLFIVMLLGMLVLLPIALGSEDRVTYMVQRFLTYSTAAVFFVLGLMNVFVAAYSVSHEISTRQAHMTLTKPLSRGQYLLGKWLGIVLLNAVLLVVSGVAIYGFTMAIARNPALNDMDRYAVDREILTARFARTADPVGTTWDKMRDAVLIERQQMDPSTFGDAGEPFNRLPNDAQQQVIAETVSRFYTVDGGTSQDFLFTGLTEAAAAAERSLDAGRKFLQEQAGLTAAQAQQYVNYVVGRPNELTNEAIAKVTRDQFDELKRMLEREVIQLVISPDTAPEPEDMFVELSMRINGQPWPRTARPGDPDIRQKLVLESKNEIAIPSSMIKPDGTLILTLTAPKQRLDGTPQPYLQFNPKDKLIELYYRVGSFEGNLARAMTIIWIKLWFLAMFGLMAGSLLTFPVAAMASLIVFIAATFSGVISESLSDYASVRGAGSTWSLISGTVSSFFENLGRGDVYESFRILIRLIGESFMLMVPAFGQFPTAKLLSEGQVIEYGMVLSAVIRIGLLWTGVVGLSGLYLFSRKELARVTV